jgi:hypothetical protein
MPADPAPVIHLHLFGAATPSGEALRQLAAGAEPAWPLHSYSRRSAAHPADFTNPAAFRPAGEPGAGAIWISFGPIWLLAPFLEQLARDTPERLAGLRGLIACSSSSALTKRFAANSFDRQLVARLRGAEEQLLATCRRLQVGCCILQPTLIYGQVGPYQDSNLSRLLQLLRRLPLVPLPAHTGLRQPIHARQLAAVVFSLVRRLSAAGWDPAATCSSATAPCSRPCSRPSPPAIPPAAAVCCRSPTACSCCWQRHCCCAPPRPSRRCCAWAPIWPASCPPTSCSPTPPSPFLRSRMQ